MAGTDSSLTRSPRYYSWGPLSSTHNYLDEVVEECKKMYCFGFYGYRCFRMQLDIKTVPYFKGNKQTLRQLGAHRALRNKIINFKNTSANVLNRKFVESSTF